MLKVNDRVRFTQDYECYPHADIKKGDLGTIHEFSEKDQRCVIQMDNLHEGIVDEWHNCIIFECEFFEWWRMHVAPLHDKNFLHELTAGVGEKLRKHFATVTAVNFIGCDINCGPTPWEYLIFATLSRVDVPAQKIVMYRLQTEVPTTTASEAAEMFDPLEHEETGWDLLE